MNHYDEIIDFESIPRNITSNKHFIEYFKILNIFFSCAFCVTQITDISSLTNFSADDASVEKWHNAITQ